MNESSWDGPSVSICTVKSQMDDERTGLANRGELCVCLMGGRGRSVLVSGVYEFLV